MPEGQWPHVVIFWGFPNTGHSLMDGARMAGNGSARGPRPFSGRGLGAGVLSHAGQQKGAGATPL